MEFKEVLSDILLGMAAGLKRDPIVILRMEGEDLLEFVNGPSYEAEMASIFSQIESPSGSLREHVIEAFGRLTVDQGVPPTSDSWVDAATTLSLNGVSCTQLSACFWN